MLAAGGPACTDARQHRHLHAALVRLGHEVVGSTTFPSLESRPDPEVGLRIAGVTQALWSLVGNGYFRVWERPGGADLIVNEEALPSARRILMISTTRP
jgi:hypothetical protein